MILCMTIPVFNLCSDFTYVSIVVQQITNKSSNLSIPYILQLGSVCATNVLLSIIRTALFCSLNNLALLATFPCIVLYHASKPYKRLG